MVAVAVLCISDRDSWSNIAGHLVGFLPMSGQSSWTWSYWKRQPVTVRNVINVGLEEKLQLSQSSDTWTYSYGEQKKGTLYVWFYNWRFKSKSNYSILANVSKSIQRCMNQTNPDYPAFHLKWTAQQQVLISQSINLLNMLLFSFVTRLFLKWGRWLFYHARKDLMTNVCCWTFKLQQRIATFFLGALAVFVW